MADGAAAPVLLVSERARYPAHALAFARILERSGRPGVAAAGSRLPPAVQRRLAPVELPGTVLELPEAAGPRRAAWLRRLFAEHRPAAVWIQQEPLDRVALETLAVLRATRNPASAVCAAAENIVPPVSGPKAVLARWALRRLDGLAANATPSVEGLRAAGLPVPAAIEILAGGVPAPPPGPARARAAGTGLRIGFAGRLVPEKGVDVLVRALAALPGATLAVAGDGPERGRLQELARELGLDGRLELLGVLEDADIWPFYRALDCLALPSRTTPRWKEQLGAVLIEAMACGVPVVGSDSGSIPEVIGDAGLVVREGDADAFADAFRRLADASLRERLGANGRARYAEHFSIDAYAGKLMRLLRLEG
ncbi:MAG TPA: glycosyltransferase [Gaiellaceae bacterium]|nr:glycosyltransferase [Gaiellaceae bacterium]